MHWLNILCSSQNYGFVLCKKWKRLEVSDLHLCGVTSMFIASKYEDINPIKLSVVHEKIAHQQNKLKRRRVKFYKL